MPNSNSNSNQNPDVDQLTQHLQHTDLEPKQEGQWVYFPPGTTLDEQLLILAGVEDWKLQGEKPGAVFSDVERQREDGDGGAGGKTQGGDGDGGERGEKSYEDTVGALGKLRIEGHTRGGGEGGKRDA